MVVTVVVDTVVVFSSTGSVTSSLFTLGKCWNLLGTFLSDSLTLAVTGVEGLVVVEVLDLGANGLLRENENLVVGCLVVVVVIFVVVVDATVVVVVVVGVVVTVVVVVVTVVVVEAVVVVVGTEVVDDEKPCSHSTKSQILGTWVG